MGDIIYIDFQEEKKARKRKKIMRELYGNTLKKDRAVAPHCNHQEMERK